MISIPGPPSCVAQMAAERVHLEVLGKKLYEQCPHGEKAELHQLVPYRTWVKVGRGGKRFWLRFLGHRDAISLRAVDETNNVIVLQRIHVLAVRTMPEGDA